MVLSLNVNVSNVLWLKKNPDRLDSKNTLDMQNMYSSTEKALQLKVCMIFEAGLSLSFRNVTWKGVSIYNSSV